MKTKQLLTVSIVLVTGVLFSSGLLAKKQEIPKVTEDGLVLVEGTKLALVYAEPGASLSPYKRVRLIESAVAFRKNWERDQHRSSINRLRISPKDIEKIKASLADEFHKTFATTLEEAGYELTNENAEDVMTIRPAIINLDINAPDVNNFGRNYSYSASAGEMTLYLEIYDSVTGDLFAKAIDRREDRASSSFYTWTNSATNKAAAKRIIKGWADILVNALNESKSVTAN